MTDAGAPAPRIRRRWPLVLAALLAAGLAGFYGLRRFDLRAYAEARLAEAIGRPVQLGALSVTLGPWTRIEARDLRLANLPGAADPVMLRAGTLRAEVDLFSLLRGPLRLRAVAASDVTLRLERVGATWNWRFRPEAGPKPPSDLRALPSLHDIAARRVSIVYAMPRGQTFRIGIAEASLAAEADNRPMHLAARGTYQGIPVTLAATLGTLDAFRKLPAPFPVKLDLGAPGAALDFDGTMTEPLDVDGAAGRLAAQGTLQSILRFGGAGTEDQTTLSLAGPFRRTHDHWRLENAAGELGAERFTARRLVFDEGGPGAPDAIAADIAFPHLDLGAVAPKGGGQGGGNPLELPLAAAANPDPRLDLALAVDALDVGAIHVDGVSLHVLRTPGLLALDQAALSWLGTRLQGTARIDGAGRASATLTARGADIGTVAHALGFGMLPIGGTARATAMLSAQGATLGTALAGARVTAVASIARGQIESRILELASTDLRLLFRRASGTTPITCGLAVITGQGLAGAVSPFRIATGKGTLAGRGSFDLSRRTLDLVFATERASTHFLALDVPVRVSGTFADPRIRPARFSAQGRAELARLLALPALPGPLAEVARRDRCFR